MKIPPSFWTLTLIWAFQLRPPLPLLAHHHTHLNAPDQNLHHPLPHHRIRGLLASFSWTSPALSAFSIFNSEYLVP